MKPLIAIPLCHDANERIRRGREYLYTDIAYARAVERAGGAPIHLPIQGEPASLVERIDGLLLPGGDDFLPDDPYPDPSVFDAASETQIAFDRGLLAAALERDLPILGICYGAQLIGLEFGASLHYHLPLDRPDANEHQLDETTGRHGLEVAPETHLASLLATRSTEVNSLHHQALCDPGPHLRVSARSPDDVIEAFEHPDRAFCIGVQWHPDKLDNRDSRALFSGLIGAARRSAG